MTQPTPSDNPQTLKPAGGGDAPPISTDSLSPKDYLRAQEDAYNNYLSELRQSGKDFKIDSKTGIISVKDDSAVKQAQAAASARYPDDPIRQKAYVDSVGADPVYTTDPIGSQYLASVNDAETALSRATEDAKAAKAATGSGGAVKSYMDTEQDKTAEITRQFKDFNNRASALYDLMDTEQQYGMNADDQNIQNMKAQRDLGTAIMPGGYYTKPYMSGSLSSILAPSLPDYVRPDYRNNAAVGLPGPEGFDNPNYDSNGMPMYAAGTDPNKPREIYWPWRNN